MIKQFLWKSLRKGEVQFLIPLNKFITTYMEMHAYMEMHHDEVYMFLKLWEGTKSVM